MCPLASAFVGSGAVEQQLCSAAEAVSRSSADRSKQQHSGLIIAVIRKIAVSLMADILRFYEPRQNFCEVKSGEPLQYKNEAAALSSFRNVMSVFLAFVGCCFSYGLSWQRVCGLGGK